MAHGSVALLPHMIFLAQFYKSKLLCCDIVGVTESPSMSKRFWMFWLQLSVQFKSPRLPKGADSQTQPQWGWHRHHDQHSKVRTELSLLAWCPCCTQVSAHSPGLPYPRSCRLSPARPTPGWFWMASTVCSLHFQGALLPAHAVLWKMIQLILQQIGFNLWCCSFSVKYTLVQGSSDRLCEGEWIWKGKAGKVWRNEA